MTIKKSLAGVSFLILLLLAGCSSQRTVPPAIAEDTKGYPFKVGLAEVDITPPVGFRIAGYYDERFSTGVHDPLKAKAIVLEEGGTRVAFVMCDLVGLSLHVTTNARAAASRLT